MPDQTVAIRESQGPVPPVSLRFVDTNLTVNNAGTAVHQQRQENPELLTLLGSIAGQLAELDACIRFSAAHGSARLQVTTMAPDGVAAESVVQQAGNLVNVPLGVLNSLGARRSNANPNVTPLLGEVPACWMLNLGPQTARRSVAVTGA